MIDLTGPPRDWSGALVSRFAAMHERSLRSQRWWRTPAPRGEPALLDRLAELSGSPRDRIVVTGGVRQFAASWAGRTPGVDVETPTFADIPRILRAGGPVRAATWEALTHGDVADGSGTVWLTSPYRNPDGRSLDPAGAAAVDRLAARGRTVIVNQVYRWCDPDGSVPVTPATAWTVTSLAKAAGGGTRLGWAVAPAAQDLTQDLTSDGPATAWQRAWAGFLDGPTFRALRAECVEPTLDARREFVGRAERSLGWTVPGGGPSLLLECVGESEEAVLARLVDRGVRASPGSAFGSAIPSIRLAFSGVTVRGAARAAAHVAGLGGTLRPVPVPRPEAAGRAAPGDDLRGADGGPLSAGRLRRGP